MNKAASDYYDGGADAESTLNATRGQFDQIKLKERVVFARKTKQVDMSTDLGFGLGIKLKSPICVGAAANQGLAHPDAEMATAKAAKELACPMILSTNSNTLLEDIAKVNPNSPKLY